MVKAVDGRCDQHLAPPVVLAAALSIGLYAAFLLMQVFFQTPVHSVGQMMLGNDFGYFFKAARDLDQGLNPYDTAGFVTPTFFPRFLSLTRWSDLPFVLAAQLMFFVTAFSVGFGIVLANKAFLGQQSVHLVRKSLGAFFVTTVLGYPFVFLIDRCNVDGLVMLCLGGFFYALRRSYQQSSWEPLAGSILAVAIGIKLYPAILILPLMLCRRYRAALAAVMLSLIFVAADFQAAIEFLSHRAVERGMWGIGMAESAGIFTFFNVVSGALEYFELAWIDQASMIMGLITYFGALGACSYGCWRLSAGELKPQCAVALVAMFTPFAISVPQVAYAYMAVNLILMLPALAVLWVNFADRSRLVRGALLLAGLGIGLTQIQSLGFATLLRFWLQHSLVWGSSSIGVALTLVAAPLILLALVRSQNAIKGPSNNNCSPEAAAMRLDSNSRIIVGGTSGAGKSTLARRFFRHWGLEISSWTLCNEDLTGQGSSSRPFAAKLKQRFPIGGWVIHGNYSKDQCSQRRIGAKGIIYAFIIGS